MRSAIRLAYSPTVHSYTGHQAVRDVIVVLVGKRYRIFVGFVCNMGEKRTSKLQEAVPWNEADSGVRCTILPPFLLDDFLLFSHCTR
jgi:hypothetical protein